MSPTFSPTSIALGVFSHSKGFGAELLSDPLWFSGADPSWAAKRFRGRFRQGSTKVLQLSWCLWGRSVLGCAKGPTKVSPMLRKFRGVYGLLGQVRLGVPKGRFRQGSPIALALECSDIVKVLGQNDTFAFLGSLPQMAFASQKVLWSVPQTVLYIGLTVSCSFFGQMAVTSEKVLWRVPPTILYICLPNGCCFIKVLWRVPPTVLYILSPSLLLGSKLRELLTCLTHTNPVHRKRPIMLLLLGHSFVLFFKLDMVVGRSYITACEGTPHFFRTW